MKSIIFLIPILALMSCNHLNDSEPVSIRKLTGIISIDGEANEESWAAVDWRAIDQTWLGELDGMRDFKGRYKLLWDSQYLYVFAETVDDTLIDIHPDPMTRYWDDDCLEVFVDEDRSGGNHQYNHSAFAYHIALNGRVLDIGTDSLPVIFNDHLESARITRGSTSFWELAIKLYDKGYVHGEVSSPVSLKQGKKIGFAIAYCDNDRSPERESFIGSVLVEGDDKNRGWIDADIFEGHILIE